MWGKRNPCMLLVGMQASATTLENNIEASQKFKHRSAIWSRNPTPGDIPKECNTGYSRSTCTPMFIAALFTIAKLWKQARCPTTNEWIKKMWYLYTWNFTQPWRRMKSYHSLVNGQNWRTSSWVRLARLRRLKIVCSLSYVDFSSRANAVMLLDLGHQAKGRAHTGGMGIGRKPKPWKCLMSPLQRN
jgi:hypothetical protein